jgi:RimJ/RimL family protein N-acetyltransferase
VTELRVTISELTEEDLAFLIELWHTAEVMGYADEFPRLRGCSLYGDHLYDLAWFEFWAPWHPGLNVAYWRTKLERRWRAVGYAPGDKEARLMACYLHIGLDHLAYNAYRGDRYALAATAKRLRTLL